MSAHPSSNLTFHWVFSKVEERMVIEQVKGQWCRVKFGIVHCCTSTL